MRLPALLRLLSIALAAGLTAASLPGRTVAATGRPMNILFISIDDLNDWIGAFGGHPDAQTPNIDRLVARGVVFRRAYTPAPICNPARAAVMTGLMPATSGVYDNRQPFRLSALGATALTLPQYLREHGYRVAGAGKIFHAQIPDDVSWDEFAPAGLPRGGGRDGRTEGERTAVPFLRWQKVDSPEEDLEDHRIAEWTIRELGRTHDRPFFVACGFKRPHLEWIAPRKYFNLYDPRKIALPEAKAGDLDDIPAQGREWVRWTSETVHPRVVGDGLHAEAVRAYLACISFVDSQVGRVLDALDASPHRDNTAIVLWSDHGFHLGEKFHWNKGTLWERSARAPLAFVVPGLVPPGTVCDQPVNLVDIYPTVLAFAGLPPRGGLDGVSLVDLLRAPATHHDRPSVTTFGLGHSSVRSHRWRYIRYRDGTEELYDHETDPQEWTNLAADSRFDSVKATHARALPTSYAPPSPHRFSESDLRNGTAERIRQSLPSTH